MEQRSNDLEILWLSPLPPIRSGVADYAMELLPELARRARVRVVEPPGWSKPKDWPSEIEVVPTNAPANDREIVVVHLGNNPYHAWLLDRLRTSKDLVVVLHDTVLHHLLVESATVQSGGLALEEGLRTAHGEAGVALAAARGVGHHGRLDPFLFPARRPFLDRAHAVLVHSRWAEGIVRQEYPSITVGRVALAVSDPRPVDRAEIRSHLGLGLDEVVLMHLGFLTPEKGIEEIVTGVAAANKAGVSVRLVMVGEGEGIDRLRDAADRAGMTDRLIVTDWIEPDVFPRLPAAADLGVVFRTPSAGETSAAALRFLACGIPVAVGGVRQFLEWPENAAPRLTPGPSASADLARLLASVGGAGWEDRCRAARSVYEESHRPADVATRMTTFLFENRSV